MPKYKVTLTGAGAMHAYAHVSAPNVKAAKKAALTKIGDVDWEYDGMDDDTVEAVQVDLED